MCRSAFDSASSEIQVSALVDSGSTFSVLPYQVGLHLGAVWERQTVPVRLGGNIADTEARAIVVIGKIREFAPVRLAFAWARNERLPVILGQTNFFMEFDIQFCRSQLFFEIRPRRPIIIRSHNESGRARTWVIVTFSMHAKPIAVGRRPPRRP